jgi:hypothetical protein
MKVNKTMEQIRLNRTDETKASEKCGENTTSHNKSFLCSLVNLAIIVPEKVFSRQIV